MKILIPPAAPQAINHHDSYSLNTDSVDKLKKNLKKKEPRKTALSLVEGSFGNEPLNCGPL
jgi:hypothetical protein